MSNLLFDNDRPDDIKFSGENSSDFIEKWCLHQPGTLTCIRHTEIYCSFSGINILAPFFSNVTWEIKQRWPTINVFCSLHLSTPNSLNRHMVPILFITLWWINLFFLISSKIYLHLVLFNHVMESCLYVIYCSHMSYRTNWTWENMGQLNN